MRGAESDPAVRGLPVATARPPSMPRSGDLAGWLLRAVLIFTMGLAGTGLLRAVVVVPTDFNRLVDEAECIFKGQVVGRQSLWQTNGSDRLIVTVVTLEVKKVMKGQVASPFALWQAGGTVGETTLSIPGLPTFEPAEEVILFVKGNGQWICPLVGIFHGKYGLKQNQQTGRPIVIGHDGNPLAALTDIGKETRSELIPSGTLPALPGVGRLTPTQGPVTEEQFIQDIQKRLAAVGTDR